MVTTATRSATMISTLILLRAYVSGRVPFSAAIGATRAPHQRTASISSPFLLSNSATMSSQHGAPSSPPQRNSTPLFMPTSSPVRPSSSASLTPRMARLTTNPMASLGTSSPLFYGGTSSSGRRTPGPSGPRSSASLSRQDLMRSVTPSPNHFDADLLGTQRRPDRIDGQTSDNSRRHPEVRTTVVKSSSSAKTNLVN